MSTAFLYFAHDHVESAELGCAFIGEDHAAEHAIDLELELAIAPAEEHDVMVLE